ncbi:hypothetical protein L1987_21797 [Smallanthus sonchifolius]|uniref:Uncharacterized protein n=1 Tax=Smallanthus sonchifolius TaxID=185202 RepID=A0ACB9ID93_9ASTR|nr:hypothetical protein L1987_21797 [Smallanthus sonchifolius]
MSSIIIFTFLILLIPPFSISSPEDDNLTAYEVIESYGFPKGILPIGVTGYELDKSTGKFKAFFNGTCSFSLEGTYDLKYKSAIGGIISKGKLTNLTGVSVKVFFFWLNIVEVYTTEDELGFSVGIASAGFPIDNFEMCPQCGCGMDCNGVSVRKNKTDLFVSSL